MKKLEYKLLPCVFCTIGLNFFVVGHNLVQASIQKLTHHNENLNPVNEKHRDSIHQKQQIKE